MNRIPSQRKQHILESLTHMLESQPGVRITTAKLAAEVGVSEAALYRHFPSKAKMYEGLIDFIEASIFSRITRILDEEKQTARRCSVVITMLLAFAEKNPGLCRILTGEALSGETDYLRQRVSRFFDRIESQVKQILRESEARKDGDIAIDVTLAANLIVSIVDGRIAQYVRSDFKLKPTTGWPQQWTVMHYGLFVAK